MFGLKKDVGTHIRLLAPELGRRREPSPHLRAHRRGVDSVLAEVMRIERTAEGAASQLLASQLSEATVTLLAELTGEDFAPLREKLACHAHLGCSVATAEDLSDGCAVGLTEPHVDTALLYLALENKVADELLKALTDWMMEAGYYLRRTGREVADVVPTLRQDLPRLFPDRIAPVAPAAPVTVMFPTQRHTQQAGRRTA
ncbi:MAG TPA: hypothetical protein VMZ00_14885 [Sporichthya sp.]|nr:hypothetical protein [Sporichthya sp.]